MMESNEQNVVRKGENDLQSADSSSSSNGRGSGSGGYNADCSSSDASSDSSLKRKNGHSNMPLNKLALDKSNEMQENAAATSDAATIAEDPQLQPSEPEKRPTLQQCDGLTGPSAGGRSSNNVASKMGALDALLEQGRKMKEEPLLPDQMMILPQLNGVRISHPMDPRIDLSAVGHLPGGSVPVATNGGQSQAMNLIVPQEVSQPPAPSIDNYLNLMEAVRPYFMSYGMPSVHHMPESHEASKLEKEGSDENQDGTPSSEGFTAFFTTTSDSNSNSDRKSNKESDARAMDENVKISELPTKDETIREETATSHAKDMPDDSDNSSMVVLARVKRKHLRKQQAVGQGDDTNLSGGSQSKDLSFPDIQPNNEETGNERSEQGVDDQQVNANMAQPNEFFSTSSSSEGNQPVLIQGQHETHQRQGIQDNAQGQIRIVSEVSSTTNTANNTSGSGSGGNSGTNSGSNSNQNSSGSGNENQASSGSCNENQASSGSGNDVARDDKCAGERSTVQTENGRMKVRTEDDEIEKLESRKPQPSQEDDEASREKKLQDKKRKRMNMRREYEEQVQQELGSESSSDTLVLRPGKPVTLDAVLSFSKTARIVVQATPPFVVVHANAAYSGLTGIHCHSIIGKPIRDVLQLPESKELFNLTEINNADGSHSGQSSMTNSANAAQKQTKNGVNRGAELNHAAAAAAGHARAKASDTKDMDIERLMTACAFGHVHVINVVSKPHQILGRNVTVVRDGVYCVQDHQQQQQRRDGEQGSQGSSIPSSESPFQFIPYCMSVSPIVSSTNALDLSAVLTEQENKSSKRRKYHNSHRRHSRNNLVTHYVLQLVDLPPPSRGNKQLAEESLSSTSKSNSIKAKQNTSQQEQSTHSGEVAHAQEDEDEEDIDDDSESTDPKEAVSAIG
eukprot:CAMPEP_0178907100 /NCGR_PEP_ID=MMETSP0786-20121207/7185_1 /TAXON_ID=186022 /ORGANISM="Thalassionema frauenfeldii, Strain CCMP 1798" /LENGTH=906 /DNA_ID=CAMNT_0020578865 /DNA_START=21 /DNA_END=2744 /DNA_ORIENTATION=-